MFKRGWHDPYRENRKKNWIPLVMIIVGLLVVGVYQFGFNAEKKCGIERCFVEALNDCQKASYVSEKDGNVWRYRVIGNYYDNCRIKVENLKFTSLSTTGEVIDIEGKAMICDIPKSETSYVEIENRLEFCTGTLKESLQRCDNPRYTTL